MTSPRTILSAIAVAAALTIGLAPAAHAEPTESSDAGGTASPEPTPETVEPTATPTDDPSPTAEPSTDPSTDPSTEPTTVAPTTTASTTQPQPTTSAPAPTTTTPAPTSTTSSAAPTSGTSTAVTASTTATTATSTTAPVFYENCSAVHAAGQPFLFTWEPGYRTELDRDIDGIACEWRERFDAGNEQDRHRGDNPDDDSDDSWCTDNDWRVLVVTIPVTTTSSSYTYYGDDDTDATYTQWPTVPDGPIATGQL